MALLMEMEAMGGAVPLDSRFYIVRPTDADFLLKIASRDIAAYEHLVLNHLTRLPNVQNLKTMVVLSTVKDETAYNLEGVNHVQQDRP